MIYYTPESGLFRTAVPRIGLNITCGTWRKPYVTFRWVWYDTQARMLSIRRFRIRLYQWPAFIWGRERSNVVNSWLWDNDMVPVYRTLLEDEAPRILAIMELYKSHDYPPEGTELKISRDQLLSTL